MNDKPNEWVNKLIATDEHNNKSTSSEYFLQTQAKRYAICFEELIRQVSLKSTKTASLLQKLWQHEQELLVKVFAKYSKQTAETNAVKDQIQWLSKSCIAKVKASQHRLQNMTGNVQKTQQELVEREVELKRLRRALTQCIDENERLRSIIASHIDGQIEGELKSTNGWSFDAKHPIGDVVDDNEAILDEISEVMDTTFTHLDDEGKNKEFLLRNLGEALVELEKKYKEKMRELHMSRRVKDFSVQVDIDPNADVLDDPPPMMPQVPLPPGRHIPIAIRGMMKQFPKPRCLASQRAVSKTILHLYHQKILSDEALDKKGQPHESAGTFLYNMFQQQYSLQTLTDMHVAQFLESIRRYTQNKRIRIFATFISVFATDEPPSSDMQDLDFLLSFLAKLGEEMEGGFDAAAIDKDPVDFLIPRSTAIVATRELFQPLLFKESLSLVSKVGKIPAITTSSSSAAASRTAEASEEDDDDDEKSGSEGRGGDGNVERGIGNEAEADNQKVRLDDVLSIIFGAWQKIATEWEKKLREMFDSNCAYYELVRGGAGGLKEEVEREAASEEAIKTLRRDGFKSILSDLELDLTETKMEELFNEACEKTFNQRKAQVKTDWQKAVDAATNRVFFYNLKTNSTQWHDPIAKLEDEQVSEIPYSTLRQLMSEHAYMRRADFRAHEVNDAGKLITQLARKKLGPPKEPSPPTEPSS